MINNTDTVIVGKKQISEIKKETSCSWLSAGIKAYNCNNDVLTALKNNNYNNYNVVVICASWCEDTQHLLPQFISVTEKINLKNVDYFFVDRDKKSPENTKENFNVDRIPTFIIYKNGKEIGRIIETVDEPIENVLNKIFK